MATWRILTRDANGNLTGELDSYLSGTSFILRYNGFGTFVIEIPWEPQGLNVARRGGLHLMRDDIIIMSGHITGWKRTQNLARNTVQINGADDLKLLSYRVCPPVYSGPPYSGDDYDIQTDKAETVVKYYVDKHAGPGAIISRRIPGLTIAPDLSAGSTVTGSARFDKLDEMVIELANLGGLGVSIKGLIFDAVTPKDLSDTIVFGLDYGTLDGLEYEYGMPVANYVYVGGTGELTLRAFEERGNAQSILDWQRVESFYDWRRSAVVAELLEAADKNLLEKVGAQTWTLSVIEQVGRVPFVDYQLGDTVSIYADGVQLPAVFSEAKIDLSPGGIAIVTPVLSATGLPIRLVDAIEQRQITTRVRRLEGV